MADPIQGKVDFIDANGEPRLHIDPDKADLFLGGSSQDGTVVLINGNKDHMIGPERAYPLRVLYETRRSPCHIH